MATPREDGWWTEKEAAAFLGFKVATLQAWRYRGGKGPEFTVMNGRAVRYQIYKVKQWAEQFGTKRFHHAPTERVSPTSLVGERVRVHVTDDGVSAN